MNHPWRTARFDIRARLDIQIGTHAAWGLHWLRTPERWPEWRGACDHNARMAALQIMALEAACAS